MTDESELRTEVSQLRAEVSELTTSVRELVVAWNTARGVVRFVRWMGALATAVTALWALIRMAKG